MMARIVAYVPDLLFGSNVVGMLSAAGHDVQLVPAPPEQPDADLLVVDLTAEAERRIEAVRAAAPDTPKLAFYAHVEPDVRAQAERAGFDLVVPRSRMAREGAALADRLLAGDG
jgi:DNA-binding NarL/FixJ family response regulator